MGINKKATLFLFFIYGNFGLLDVSYAFFPSFKEARFCLTTCTESFCAESQENFSTCLKRCHDRYTLLIKNCKKAALLKGFNFGKEADQCPREPTIISPTQAMLPGNSQEEENDQETTEDLHTLGKEEGSFEEVNYDSRYKKDDMTLDSESTSLKQPPFNVHYFPGTNEGQIQVDEQQEENDGDPIK